MKCSHIILMNLCINKLNNHQFLKCIPRPTNVNNIDLTSLLLNLRRFHISFWCLDYLLWTNKCWQGSFLSNIFHTYPELMCEKGLLWLNLQGKCLPVLVNNMKSFSSMEDLTKSTTCYTYHRTFLSVPEPCVSFNIITSTTSYSY